MLATQRSLWELTRARYLCPPRAERDPCRGPPPMRGLRSGATRPGVHVHQIRDAQVHGSRGVARQLRPGRCAAGTGSLKRDRN